MDPVTHALTGAAIARAGLNRRAAYTTAAMAIGAEFPDIDTVWSWFGPVTGFQHHRGITHTFIGLPVEALAIVGGLWLWHRWRVRRQPGNDSAQMRSDGDSLIRTTSPVRWTALYAFTLLALLSHIALDWTNNYGVRPFFPFDPHWYAGYLLFIVDPLVLLFLAGALVLPLLFRLIGSEVGAKAAAFPPKRWAVGALLGIAALLSLRAVEHARAIDLALGQMTDAAPTQADASAPLLPSRVLASPDPFSPFHWHAVADFGSFLQLEELDTRRAVVSFEDERLDKPPASPALESALNSRLGRVYMNWSPMPVLSVNQGTGEGSGGAASTVVYFRDPRFMGAVPLLNREGPPPLSGAVELDRQNRVVTEMMNGREQR